MKKVELRDKILNEVLEDVRKYRDYLSYKSKKNSKKISPKFNFWDLRNSIEESLNHYLKTGITNPIIRENQRSRVQSKNIEIFACPLIGNALDADVIPVSEKFLNPAV